METEYIRLYDEVAGVRHELSLRLEPGSRGPLHDRYDYLIENAYTIQDNIRRASQSRLPLSNALINDAQLLIARMQNAAYLLPVFGTREQPRSLQSLAEYQVFVNNHPNFAGKYPEFERVWPYLRESQRNELLNLPGTARSSDANRIVYVDPTPEQRAQFRQAQVNAGVMSYGAVLFTTWDTEAYNDRQQAIRDEQSGQRQRGSSFVPTGQRVSEGERRFAAYEQILEAPSFGTSSGSVRSVETRAYQPIISGGRSVTALQIPGELAAWVGISEEGSYRS